MTNESMPSRLRWIPAHSPEKPAPTMTAESSIMGSSLTRYLVTVNNNRATRSNLLQLGCFDVPVVDVAAIERVDAHAGRSPAERIVGRLDGEVAIEVQRQLVALGHELDRVPRVRRRRAV